MPKYTLCPRCELNYMLEGEEYCDVCKAELNLGPQLMFSTKDENEGQILCPICKLRYIDEDEECCEQCREALKQEVEIESEDEMKDDEWRQYLDDDEKDVLASGGDEEEMLLSQIEEEESLDDELDEEDIDPYTNEKIDKSKKIDDDDFDYGPINEADFEEEDEEDEEDEDKLDDDLD